MINKRTYNVKYSRVGKKWYEKLKEQDNSEVSNFGDSRKKRLASINKQI